MLSFIYAWCHMKAFHAKCRYTECHYAERRYADCRGVTEMPVKRAPTATANSHCTCLSVLGVTRHIGFDMFVLRRPSGPNPGSGSGQSLAFFLAFSRQKFRSVNAS